MKCLITGGAGFIGSHLVQRFVDVGYQVSVLDNFSTGNRSYIQNLIDEKKISLIVGDVTDAKVCDEITKGIEVVVHLAAHVSVQESRAKPELTQQTNVVGTFNMLQACIKNQVRRFINISSSAVYGDLDQLPVTENSPTIPTSLYGSTKLTQENDARVFSKLYGLETISLRFFNVFGPRQSSNSSYAAAIPAFIKNALNHEPSTIYGDGQQTRDFIYVLDVVNAIEAAVEAPRAEGQVYNVGTGNKISILELSQEIQKICGSSQNPLFQDRRDGDILHSYSDITKIQNELQWKPKHSFRDGLIETVTWMRNS